MTSVLGGPTLIWQGRILSIFGLMMDGAALISLVVICQWLLSQRGAISLTNGSLHPESILAGLTVVATFCLMLLVESYYFRYTLPILLPAMMCVAAMLATGQSIWPSVAAWSTTGIIGILSLVGIQDGMQRSRAFWSAIEEVHQRGVEPSDVDAGMAYVGFYRFNPQYRGDANIGPFLSDLPNMVPPEVYEQAMANINPETITSGRPILVSFRKEPGYDVLGKTQYHSWFRSGDVFILLHISQDQFRHPEAVRKWIRENQ